MLFHQTVRNMMLINLKDFLENYIQLEHIILHLVTINIYKKFT